MFPLSPEEREANLLSRRLSASGIDPALGGPDRLARARRLFDQKRYPAAANEFLSLLKESPSDAVVRFAARAQFAGGRYSEAASLFDRWVKRASTPEARAEGRYWVMRAYGRIDRLDRVDRALASFADEEKGTIWYGRALILRGKLQLDEGNREEARSSFRRVVGEFPQDEMIEEALWYWGWAEYEAGAMDAARLAWKKLTAEFPRSALAARAAYWAGRAAERQGNIDAARRDYRRVVETGPSYYGFLAEERLKRRTTVDAIPAERGRRGPPRDPGTASRVGTDENWAGGQIPERLRGTDSIRRAQILLRLGLQGEARRELARANRGCGGEVRCVVAVNDLLIEAGDFRSAVLAFEGWGDPGALPGPARRQFFPKAYWTELKRFADREEIDPYLVLAVVREESRFDPEAVSRAGALGLM
ncbi:MAG: tetratricopeptide repeat protein, partial [Nitrospirae bacterium]|nr:tetratricopeptide repeat protein [Nitrospirota bacterium]